MKIVRVLSVSLLIFGVSLGSQEARGCDLCGFEECWFEPDVVVSRDLAGDDSNTCTDDMCTPGILAEIYSVAADVVERDPEMLMNLIDFADQEGMLLEHVLLDYAKFRQRASQKDRRSPKRGKSRIIAWPNGNLSGGINEPCGYMKLGDIKGE